MLYKIKAAFALIVCILVKLFAFLIKKLYFYRQKLHTMKTIAIFLALMLPMTMSAQNYEAYHVNTVVYSATTDTRSAASDWTRSNTAWDE